jgi:hypothetical protein
MASLGELFSDDYNFETLVVPAMVIALPVMVVLALFGLNISWLVGFAILGIQVLLFPLWLMASWIRDAGKKLEARLFADGQPTHTSLRLANGSSYDLQTRRQRLEAVAGVKLATLHQERANPAEADAKIRDAMAVAREKMRDPMKFKLLRRELKSYGFWRNIAGCRTLGLLTTGVCVLLSIGAILLSTSIKLPVAALACAAAMFLYWLLVVSDEKVIQAAERYKNQFFNSLATL